MFKSNGLTATTGRKNRQAVDLKGKSDHASFSPLPHCAVRNGEN
jgi:hypothetical protein